MILWIFACLLPTLFTTSTGQQCKNDLGETVDWIVGYKPPGMKSQQDPFLKKGTGYLYVSSKDSSADWKLSSKSVNDTTSFLGRTLSPLYTESAKSLLYLMYNDEPPSVPGSSTYGHSKGVVITDGKVGMWLVHSSPKFPIEPITLTAGQKNSTATATATTPTKNKYSFPVTATRFGQSFLCITLPPNQMDKVGQALQYIKPKVYSQNLPNSLAEKFPELSGVTRKKTKKKGPWNLKTSLKTVGGREFVSYAKSKEFNQDLYSDWLAPDLHSDIQVETWSNGPNELPSDCNKTYRVMDVKDVEIKVDNRVIRFKNSQDHSKWAVTVNSNTTIVCIGDINRMLAQFKRGGGTVCYKNAFVWRRYAKAVADVQPCPLNPKKTSDNIPPRPPVPSVPRTGLGPVPGPFPPTQAPKTTVGRPTPTTAPEKRPTDIPPRPGHQPKNPKPAQRTTTTTTTTSTTPKPEKKKSFISGFVDKLFGFSG